MNAHLLRFDRWSVLFLLIATAFGQGLATCQTVAAERPNVLLILADDLGYSDLGCYGGEIETPNLDSLAANGLRYTQFYNTARCWPTRGAIMTGYYAQQINRDALEGKGGGARGRRPSWATLLPEQLKSAGYRAYVSGKWHIDGKPLETGFDHSYIIEDHDRFFHPKRIEKDGKALPPVDPDSDFYLTTAVASHAIECLKEHASAHADKPFFHFLTFTSPHFPLQAPASDVQKYRDRYTKGWDLIRAERYARQQAMQLTKTKLGALEESIGPPYAFPEAIAKLGPGEVIRELPWQSLTDVQKSFQAAKMAVHAAMVDRMDQEIGRVLAQLKSMNAMENTLILFLSDNGASAEIMVRGDGHNPEASPGSRETFLCLGPGWSRTANTPHRRHKTWVHEGGISTPLIAHWPAGLQGKNELRQQPGHVIDIVPTVLEIAGVAKPNLAGAPPMPGKSLVESMTKGSAERSEPLWFLHEGNRALRLGKWKVVSAKNEPWQLYDLDTDRAEAQDLSAQNPTKLKELVSKWETIAADTAKLVELSK